MGASATPGTALGRHRRKRWGVADAPALSVTSAKCVWCAAQNAALVVLPLNLQLVAVERVATRIPRGPGSRPPVSTQPSVPELRQPPRFVAAPLAASAVSESEAENQGGMRSGNRSAPPPTCHQDLTVSWRNLCATAEAITPCTRGVSDLGRRRGHDRKRGQISWGTPAPDTVPLPVPSEALPGERSTPRAGLPGC